MASNPAGTKPLYVYLPVDMHRALAHIAIDLDTSASDIVRELIAKYLDEQPPRQ